LKVSADGWMKPVWSRNGRELFFLTLSSQLMTVSVDTTGAALRVGVPDRLFTASYFSGEGPSTYDVSSDGTRFLMIKEDPAVRPPNTPIVMILNAVSSLAARATGR
jgi:hypothetical protein